MSIRAAMLVHTRTHPLPTQRQARFAFFHSRMHVRSIPACLSTVPGHMFSQVSAAPLGLTFTCTSTAGSGSSTEQTIGAEIVPHFLTHSIPGPPCARGFTTPS